jgi:two-component system, OmpR family, phosphate regulon response regulator PhoB
MNASLRARASNGTDRGSWAEQQDLNGSSTTPNERPWASKRALATRYRLVVDVTVRDVQRRVLVVDDDEGVRTGVTWALEADGFSVEAVQDGVRALEMIESDPPALVVLDLSLPGISGLDILRRVRQREERDDSFRLPIIVLSGRDGETDRIVGLDLGADDYLVKPFSPGELAARARSVLRRCGDYGSQPSRLFVPQGVGVEIDAESRDVWVDGEPVELAAKEFELLAYFVDHPRRACTRDELLAAVWSSSEGWQTPATVTEHVYRLRQKVEENPGRPRRLRTVRAVGYRWEG